MSNHILSIIPLACAMILVVIGLAYGSHVVQGTAAVTFAYGLAIHANNVRFTRRANRQNTWNRLDKVLG